LGALRAAQKAGAQTVLIHFNQNAVHQGPDRPHVVLAPRIGPEVLTGSTRLKAGTATKLILNIITTLTMVRLGKVISNLMVDVHPANYKLRERAVRILQALAGCDAPAARQALEQNAWRIPRAWHRLPRRKVR
jgi:N-acetylmuramic acid 6-phosphate (MurNAc-6-P) etherase